MKDNVVHNYAIFQEFRIFYIFSVIFEQKLTFRMSSKNMKKKIIYFRENLRLKQSSSTIVVYHKAILQKYWIFNVFLAIF